MMSLCNQISPCFSRRAPLLVLLRYCSSMRLCWAGVCLAAAVALLLPSAANATTCASVGSAGSAVYRCTDSGNTATNGTNFRDTFAAATCGDTIVLPAGVTFSTGTSAEAKFNFPLLSCSGWVTIQSSKSGELPEGVRVDPADSAKFATLEANGSGGAAAQFAGGVHHYKFVGIIFTTGSNIAAVAGIVNGLAVDDKTTATIGNWPHHIWFDRCIFRPYEYAAGASDPFRSASFGVNIEGEEVWVTNSLIYGFMGTRTDVPTRTVSAATNSTAPEITVSHGYPASSLVGFYITGATGNWTRLNGWKYGVASDTTHSTVRIKCQYITDTSNTATCTNYYNRDHNLQTGDTVTVSGVTYSGATSLNGVKTITVTNAYEFTFASSGVADGSYCSGGEDCLYQDSGGGFYVAWDSTGAGSLTGTVTSREPITHNSLGVAIVGSPGPFRIENNYISAWFSGIFTGGGGLATQYSATMSSVGPSGATLSNVIGLQIGDIAAVKTSYTGYLSGWRTVRIDTINTSTGEVTWTPWGITKLMSTAEPTASGTCTTSGTAVTTSFAIGFQGVYSGVPITINGVGYTVSFLASSTSLVLTGSAGTQSSVACSLAMLPDEGGAIRWRGIVGPKMYVSRNTFDLPSYGYPHSGICKGAHEWKIMDGAVWNGNTYTGFPCVTIGCIPRNQSGATPWASIRNLQYTNNLILNAERSVVYGVDDDLETTVRANVAPGGDYGSGNMRFRNNLFLDASTVSKNVFGLAGGTQRDEVWERNTFFRPASGSATGSTFCNLTSVPTYGTFEFTVRDNLLRYGTYGFNTGSCWIDRANKLTKNLLVDNQSLGSSQINTDAPGNLYTANDAAIGFVGTCDASGTNWKNCKLDSGAAHAGAGTDGNDPGADPVVIEDHTNGWSVEAGLQERWGNTLRPQQIGSTRAAISFRLRNSTAANCTLVLYTDADYRTEHGDTNTSGEKACNRSGNTLSSDGTVNFVLGGNTALTASTTYYFEITDGSRKMRWSFTTKAAGGGLSFAHSSAGQISANADMSSPTSFTAGETLTIPAGEVRYYRPTGGATRVLVAN